MAQTGETEAYPRTQKKRRKLDKRIKRFTQKRKKQKKQEYRTEEKKTAKECEYVKKTFGLGKLTESTLLGAI
jgi:hypothetical protein